MHKIQFAVFKQCVQLRGKYYSESAPPHPQNKKNLEDFTCVSFIKKKKIEQKRKKGVDQCNYKQLLRMIDECCRGNILKSTHNFFFFFKTLKIAKKG